MSAFECLEIWEFSKIAPKSLLSVPSRALHNERKLSVVGERVLCGFGLMNSMLSFLVRAEWSQLSFGALDVYVPRLVDREQKLWSRLLWLLIV
jgi:hypothetical protein